MVLLQPLPTLHIFSIPPPPHVASSVGDAKKTTCCCLRTYRENPPGQEVNGSAPPKGPPEATSNSNITRLQERKYH